MKKRNRIILMVAISFVVLAASLVGFAYDFGYLGIHFHTKPEDGQIKVACVGDSITYGHGVRGWRKNNYPAKLQELLGNSYHVLNFGHGGRTLSYNGDKPYAESKQYKLSLEYDADIVVFMLGTNDSKSKNWTDPDTFIAEYEKMINSYKENNPDVRIIICTPPAAFYPDGKTEGKTNFSIQPDVVEQIKTRIITFAFLNGYECIDVYDLTSAHKEWLKKDHVHLNADGAKAIAEIIYKSITK